jgi:N4-gp56 family major capsid protein
MANTITGATSAAGAGQLTNQVLTAYDRKAFFALRDTTIWDQFAMVKPGNLTSPGSPVRFHFWDDMALATTPLDEIADVDAVGLSDSFVEVTPSEYGNAVVKTLRIQKLDMLIGFDADVSNLVNENMVKTIDRLARNAFDAAGVESTVAASEAATVAGDVITANALRQKRAELRGDNVRPLMGTFYGCVIHPDVAYDLKTETGDGAWVAPAQYVNTEKIYNDEIGAFAGFRVIEHNDALINTDGGSGTVDTYTTYFMGQEALAKVEVVSPNIVMGPVTDKLRRLQPLGWHAYAGWGEFRNLASRRLISASSIGAN